MHYISILSTIITFIFAGAVLARWRYKKPRHLLFWAAGLIWYGLGTLSEVILSFTFSPLVIKLWYLSGAMLTAAWLGQGTVFLLLRKRGWASTLMILLLFVSAAAVAFVFMAPIVPGAAFSISQPVSEQYKDILLRSTPIILMTILLNIYGTITLVGGAIYSAYLFWRKNILANRMIGNVLIAAGALSPAMAGSFVKAGLMDFLYVSELLGVILMYAGFMLATSSKPAERTVSAPAH